MDYHLLKLDFRYPFTGRIESVIPACFWRESILF